MSCCRLSRCVCSLSSAGGVCWAKPNHAFFNCQQPVDVFFRARAPLPRQRCAPMTREYQASLASRNQAITCNRVEHEHWRGLQRCTHACVECVVQFPTRRVDGKRMHFARLENFWRASMQRCVCASHKSVCAKTARTFSGTRSTSHPIPGARIRRKKKTRDVAVAGRWIPDWRGGISGRRLPATRRTHPGRAGR